MKFPLNIKTAVIIRARVEARLCGKRRGNIAVFQTAEQAVESIRLSYHKLGGIEIYDEPGFAGNETRIFCRCTGVSPTTGKKHQYTIEVIPLLEYLNLNQQDCYNEVTHL